MHTVRCNSRGPWTARILPKLLLSWQDFRIPTQDFELTLEQWYNPAGLLLQDILFEAGFTVNKSCQCTKILPLIRQSRKRFQQDPLPGQDIVLYRQDFEVYRQDPGCPGAFNTHTLTLQYNFGYD